MVVDHLSRLNYDIKEEPIPIREIFSDEQPLTIAKVSWYADIANYLATDTIPTNYTLFDKNKLLITKIH